METFIAAIIVMMSLFVATFQMVRNMKYRELAERRQKMVPLVLYLNSLLVICDLSVGGQELGTRLFSDVMLVAIALSVLSSSLWGSARTYKIVSLIVVVEALLSAYYLLCVMSLSVLPGCRWAEYFALFLVLTYASLFMVGIWLRLREVRAVMNGGTVWASLTLAVDAFYAVVILAEAVAVMAVASDEPLVRSGVTVLLCGAVVGYGLRIACDSVFVMMLRQERRIVESMKISPVEVSGMGQREDDIYKDIYERVLEYFEKEKPFLNSNLAINDLVSVVFTNKLYISRAISQHTGRNFCQFVNYHRIMYSVECFRSNVDLKIAELWPMSGFNSIVSFNMAFRLFMGENPSDWCRKEKIRLSRKGK